MLSKVLKTGFSGREWQHKPTTGNKTTVQIGVSLLHENFIKFTKALQHGSCKSSHSDG